MPQTNTLLLVDDDQYDRFFFRTALNEVDPLCTLIEAEHGVQALEILRGADTLPEIIFMDINMPFMNGFECLAELKKDIALKAIPVVIYSTSNFERDINKCTELGAAHFMTKPPSIAQLPKLLKQALEIVRENSTAPNRN